MIRPIQSALLCVMCLFGAMVPLTHAQLDVIVQQVNGTSSVTQDPVTMEYRVQLDADGNAVFYVYAQAGTLPDISNIEVDADGFDVTLFIGQDNSVPPQLFPPGSLDELIFDSTVPGLDGDVAAGGVLDLQFGLIAGDLGESGQSEKVQASQIGELEIEGDVWANIEAVGPSVSGIGLILIGGNFHAGISVPADRTIDTILIDGAALGTVGQPAFIEVGRTINELTILQEADQFELREVPGALFVTNVGRVDIFGYMIGTVNLPIASVGEFIRIGRGGGTASDFTGTMDLDFARLIEIGGSLTTGSAVTITNTVPLGVVINNNDVGAQWLGDVEIFGQLLDKPQYVQTEAVLFGSASGQVPFLIHGVDSTVTFDGSTILSETAVDECLWKPYVAGTPEGLRAEVRFFGPVEPTGGWPGGGIGSPVVTPAPFVFERRPIDGFCGNSTTAWRDITHCFNASMWPVGGFQSRLIALTGPAFSSETSKVEYRNGYEYRLRPITDMPTTNLLCNLDRLNPGSPVPVGDDAITWRVGNLCPADLNADGNIDTVDLGLLLGTFGTTDPNGDCNELIGDINGDNIVDTTDLGELLGAFGNTDCGPTAPGMMAMAMMGGGGSVTSAQLLAALGYESAEAFAAFVAELEPAKQIEAITAAWVVAQSLEESAAEQSE